MDNTMKNSGSEQAGSVTLPSGYRPNAEEIKLLAECRVEGNVKGGFFATVAGVLAYQGMKYFNLKPNPRFGIYPKLSSAMVAGFIFGKLAALSQCSEKFKNSSNSPIGAYLRQKNSGRIDGLQLSMDIAPDTNLSFPATSSTQYNDSHMNSAIDIDVYSSPSSMDSYTGDELNGPGYSDDSSDQKYLDKPTVSYAELRKRNREEYSTGEKEKYNPSSSLANDASVGPPIRRPSPAGSFQEKNKYGDVWG